MSVISEWWGGANDVQRGVGIAGILALAGLATEEGRTGFKEGPVAGVGKAIGTGIYVIGGVPVKFLSSIAEGIGLKQAFDKDQPVEAKLEKLGINQSDLQGLAQKLSGKSSTEAAQKKNVLVTVLLVVVVLFVVIMILRALLGK